MRKKVLIAIADGSEEMETVIPADVLRRAGADVTLASVNKLEITASRGIKLIADKLIAECEKENFDLIVLPGGMPGAEHLRDSVILKNMLQKQAAAGKLIAAICAAPVVVLQHHGLLDGKKATCHPALLHELKNSSKERVVISDNIITSQGPGTAAEFALKLVELLIDAKTAQKVASGLVL